MPFLSRNELFSEISGLHHKIHQKHKVLATHNSSMNVPAKVPTMVAMAHKQHTRKKNAGRNKVMGVNAEGEGSEEEVTAMDDSIMSFEDVEKWIDEQERYFGKSGSNLGEGSGESLEKREDVDLISTRKRILIGLLLVRRMGKSLQKQRMTSSWTHC